VVVAVDVVVVVVVAAVVVVVLVGPLVTSSLATGSVAELPPPPLVNMLLLLFIKLGSIGSPHLPGTLLTLPFSITMQNGFFESAPNGCIAAVGRNGTR